MPGTHICLFACLFCLSLVLSSPPDPHPSIHPSIYSLIQLSIYACIYIYILQIDIHIVYIHRTITDICIYSACIYIYILIYYKLPLPLHTKAGKSSQLHVCLGGQGAPLALGHPWRLDDAFRGTSMTKRTPPIYVHIFFLQWTWWETWWTHSEHATVWTPPIQS